MRPNRIAAAVAAVIVCHAVSARASDCVEDWPFWLGTNVGLSFRADGSGAGGGMIGNEFGLLPVAIGVGGSRCLRLGVGAKLTYDGEWRAALPLRLSVGATRTERPSVYLQAGPAFRLGVPGVDAEIGVDWVGAALFAGTTWLPGDDRGYTVVFGARVSLLAGGLLLFCTFNRCYTT